jgi:PAS domain-containing protein
VPSDLIGRSIAEFVPPEIWDRTRAMLAAKLGGEESTKYEVEVFGPDKRRMTWEINSRLTRDSTDAPSGLHAIGRDVTERRRSENELRESEERFRAAADSSPALMWMTDERAQVTFANRRYKDFFGVRRTRCSATAGARSCIPRTSTTSTRSSSPRSPPASLFTASSACSTRRSAHAG